MTSPRILCQPFPPLLAPPKQVSTAPLHSWVFSGVHRCHWQLRGLPRAWTRLLRSLILRHQMSSFFREGTFRPLRHPGTWSGSYVAPHAPAYPLPSSSARRRPRRRVPISSPNSSQRCSRVSLPEKKYSQIKPHKVFSLLTCLSLALRTLSLPKRTWKGEHWRDPSGCLTTMMSIQPLRVAYRLSAHWYQINQGFRSESKD